MNINVLKEKVGVFISNSIMSGNEKQDAIMQLFAPYLKIEEQKEEGKEEGVKCQECNLSFPPIHSGCKHSLCPFKYKTQ